MKKDQFQNKKAENYFRLDALYREDMISTHDLPEKAKSKLKYQLIAIRKKRTSSAKWRIEDPEDYSPDRGDGLVYMVWKDKSSLAWLFG